MSRKPTPSPETSLQLDYGCASFLIVISGLAAYYIIQMRLWGFLIFCAPAIGVTIYWLYGRILLLVCMYERHRRGIRGIVVTSASPNWSDYIEKNWLSRLGDQFKLLNMSEKKKWDKTLSVRVFSHFCDYWENYCPAILLYRGLRRPLVFRFFYAFRDHKHGNEEALRNLEDNLFNLLNIER